MKEHKAVIECAFTCDALQEKIDAAIEGYEKNGWELEAISYAASPENSVVLTFERERKEEAGRIYSRIASSGSGIPGRKQMTVILNSVKERSGGAVSKRALTGEEVVEAAGEDFTCWPPERDIRPEELAAYLADGPKEQGYLECGPAGSFCSDYASYLALSDVAGGGLADGLYPENLASARLRAQARWKREYRRKTGF